MNIYIYIYIYIYNCTAELTISVTCVTPCTVATVCVAIVRCFFVRITEQSSTNDTVGRYVGTNSQA